MESGKFGLTLFDILGYLFPGYLVVFSLSFFESTYLPTSILSFESISKNLFFFTIVAYFLGHLCHIIGSLVKDRAYRFMSKKDRLNGVLYEKFRKEICKTYSISTEEAAKLNKLDMYTLADNFIVSSGLLEERSSLIVREGFHKSASIAFGTFFLIVFSSIFRGGLKFQGAAGSVEPIGIGATVVFSVVLLLIFLMFVNRYVFFNRIKVNSTYLLFLAIRKKQAVPKNG